MSTANEVGDETVQNEATSDGQVHHGEEAVPNSLNSEGNISEATAEARAKLQALLSVDEVVLSEELAELLRHRELEWSCTPLLSRSLVLPYLTLKETLRLDSAVTERGDEENPRDRDHLEKAYVGLRSAGFDE